MPINFKDFLGHLLIIDLNQLECHQDSNSNDLVSERMHPCKLAPWIALCSCDMLSRELKKYDVPLADYTSYDNVLTSTINYREFFSFIFDIS